MNTTTKKLATFLLFFFIATAAQASRTVIKVGVYDFPPFAEWHTGKLSGLTLSLVNLLNSKQDKFLFDPVETSPNRRYEDLRNKLYDVIFFESIQWGWLKENVVASKVFLEGGEVFIAKNDKGRDQSFFNELKGKSIRGILGYHYQFANFSTDPKVLKQWNLELTNSHEGNIISVVEGRSDLAIVTKEYLDIYVRNHPQVRNKILVSKKMDQVYHHTILLRKDASISVKEINALLDKIKKDSSLKQMLIKF